MVTNLLRAINNLIESQDNDLKHIYKGSNRMNIMGEALEYYVKDLFCGCLKEKEIDKKEKIYSEYFSYIGNQNNPPDFIISDGDAIEVKKTEGFSGSLELNSSYPRSRLYVDDPMITTACKDCEDWKTKDVAYIVGTLKEGKVRLMWFVYGDCYAADREVYEKIRNTIVKGVKEIRNVELSDTNELGRVNKVDPLGITYLRVRGMWGIESPLKAFNYIIKSYDKKNGFTAYAIIPKSKYDAFPKEDRDRLEGNRSNGASIEDIKIKNPNNPARYLEAKLITVIF